MKLEKWIENFIFLNRYGLITGTDLAVTAGQVFLTGGAMLLGLLNPEPVGAVLGLCLSAWLLPYAGAWMHSFFVTELQDKEDIKFLPLDEFLDGKDWESLEDGGEDIPF